MRLLRMWRDFFRFFAAKHGNLAGDLRCVSQNLVNYPDSCGRMCKVTKSSNYMVCLVETGHLGCFVT